MGRTLQNAGGEEKWWKTQHYFTKDWSPPFGYTYTDIVSMTQLQPKEIARKIQADFAMDPMLIQSRPVRDIITQQISHQIRLTS